MIRAAIDLAAAAVLILPDVDLIVIDCHDYWRMRPSKVSPLFTISPRSAVARRYCNHWSIADDSVFDLPMVSSQQHVI